MRKVRHITVAVTPELYRQTRHLAAEYDTTVTAMVAWLLERLPNALKASRFPRGKSPASPGAPAPAITPSPAATSAPLAPAGTAAVPLYATPQPPDRA